LTIISNSLGIASHRLPGELSRYHLPCRQFIAHQRFWFCRNEIFSQRRCFLLYYWSRWYKVWHHTVFQFTIGR